ncbi:MAG: YfhO family protein [Paramuribaculum sp.]|nr:YfhO family protein [Paramuribaculum sp.]
MNKETLKNFLRRPAVLGSIISLAVIALLSLIYFYPDAIQGNELRQYDTMQGAAIGHESQIYKEATGQTPRWTNSLFGGMPTFQISPSYPSDTLFTWFNKAMGLGLPTPANLLAMMMIGFFILLITMKMRWYVALLGAIAYGFSSYFIIIIGAGHIWKFLTLTYIPPTIAGIILAYRGRYLAGAALAAFFAMMQISSNHVQMTYYFLFVIVGFVVAYFFICLNQKQLLQWAKATGCLLVGAVLAVGANSPSLYNTYEYSKETMRGGHSRLSSESQQNETDGGLNKDYITQYSYGTGESFTLLIPNVKGGASVKPEKGQMKQLSLADLQEVQKMIDNGTLGQAESWYLNNVSQYFGEPEGTNGPVYVGALIVALFLVGCGVVKGPFKWTLIALTIISILLALGRNCMWLTDLMIDYMPMYNKFRTPESILVIAEFTMPLMAALALQKLLTDKDSLRKYKKPLYWGFGISMGLCLIGLVFPGLYGSVITDSDRMMDAQIAQYLQAMGADQNVIRQMSLNNPAIYTAIENVRYGMIRSDALRSFLIVAAGAGFLLLYFRQKIGVAVAAGALGVIIVIDMFGVNKRYLDSDSFVAKSLDMPDQFEQSPWDKLILQDTAMNYRVMDIPRFMLPNPSYWHKAVGGYHAAKLTSYQDLIDRHLIHFLEGNPAEADSNVLNMLNAKYIIDSKGQPSLNTDALGNAWFIDTLKYVKGADAEMAALSEINPATTAVVDETFHGVLGEKTAKAPGDTIFETTYAPDKLTYYAETKNGGIAVFSEIYFPWGWKATVDGQPVDIARVNYVLRAIPIPAGKHTVEMVFDPDSIKNTTTLAYVSILLIYIALAGAFALWIVRPQRKDDLNDEDAV